VSGHPCQEEIKLIYSLVRPKYAFPVHGEWRHRIAQSKIARMLGYDSEHILMIHSGDVLEICESEAKVTGHVQTGGILVDGLGVGDVGNIVLRDRQHLAEDGIIIVALTLGSQSGLVLAGPDVVSRGFVYVRESEELMDEAQEVIAGAIKKASSKKGTDWTRIKNLIRDDLSDFLWKRTKRSPMILPIIEEVDG